MSHIIYDRVVLEHLFLLEQMAHGSLACVKFLGSFLDNSKTHDYLQSEAETAVYGYGGVAEGYWDNVHKLVSDYLIQCATRTRIMQDFSDFSTEDPEYCPDKESFSKYPTAAKILQGNFNLSLRECCNKIIHAKNVELIMEIEASTKLKYWNGFCILSGSKLKNTWKLELNISVWVIAMRHYYDVTQHLS
ncbi:hypothetical protein [Cellvibrio sp. pealriver]|uniref:hypothetical protein n=1 Tax=Cellvibrio sp. pealriver TaxID=1622269 RepID=UPI00066FEF6C|nr:hypothetical protein [Cellvibrio sp. pealriver]